MSRQALENTKNKLKEEIELAKNLLSEQNKNFTKARSAAVTKNFSKNNTTAHSFPPLLLQKLPATPKRDHGTLLQNFRLEPC